MTSSNVVKVIAAFVGGIIVTLGSALIYVKAHERSSPQAIVQTAPPPIDNAPLPDTDRGATPPVVAQTPEKEEPVEPPAPKPAPKPIPKKVVNTAVSHRNRHTIRTDSTAAAPSQPMEVAQNSAPPQPAANPYTTAPVAPAQTHEAAPAPLAPPPPPPVRQPRTVTIPAGTLLSVRLGEKLSTDTNSAGDAFRATLEAPLILDGAVIADRGSKVLGKVVNAEKAGRVKGVSDLQLALTEINTTDGQRVEIQTAALDNQGQGGKGKDAAKVGGGAALGAIIGAIAGGGKGAGIGAGIGGAAGAGDVLLTRGKSVVLPVESKLKFQLSAPVSITERLNY